MCLCVCVCMCVYVWDEVFIIIGRKYSEFVVTYLSVCIERLLEIWLPQSLASILWQFPVCVCAKYRRKVDSVSNGYVMCLDGFDCNLSLYNNLLAPQIHTTYLSPAKYRFDRSNSSLYCCMMIWSCLSWRCWSSIITTVPVFVAVGLSFSATDWLMCVVILKQDGILKHKLPRPRW